MPLTRVICLVKLIFFENALFNVGFVRIWKSCMGVSVMYVIIAWRYYQQVVIGKYVTIYNEN